MPLQLRSLPALLLAALLPLTGLAQSPAPEPLELAAAERILLDANPAILQARAAQAAARAGIDMAGARPNPQLTLGSTSTDPGRAGSRGFWNSWTDNTVRVDQLFERGNKRDLRLAAADLNLSASGADLANTIRLARIDLANAWLDLRVAREIRRIASENAALAQRAADAAEVRGKAGDLAGVDVARFRADAARVANDALQAELAHTRARIALAQLLGNRLPSAQLDTSDDWPAAAPAPAGDTGERPDLLAARQRTQQASALRSGYSWKLLELLMRFESTGWAEYTIEDFKASMDAPPSLSDFGQVKRRIIDPAVKELTEKDGWLIQWQPIKAGRKVKALRFTFMRDPQGQLPL